MEQTCNCFSEQNNGMELSLKYAELLVKQFIDTEHKNLLTIDF